MKIGLLILAIALVAVAALMAWVRLAPSDPARWHGALTFTKDEDKDGGAIRVLPVEEPNEVLAALDRIATATPRTQKLAGSVEEGSITYITRSAFWGFPDYTTITALDGRVILFARLRFGQSDFGVNRARLEDWISQLEAEGT